MNHQPWMVDAPCATVNPELFFPPSGAGNRASAEAAKAVCATCPARLDCLTYALTDTRLYGIWGGTTELERDKLRVA